jgi:hypothetical protein
MGGDPAYEIRVKGHLDPAWSAWFDGLAVTNLPDGTAELHGELPDDAALHGALQKIRDLGLTLLSFHAQPVRRERAE